MENTVFFREYCNYCTELTRNYNSKFYDNNKVNNIIINIHILFCDNINKQQDRIIKPTAFLTCGLDFNDDVLFEYFENLII
jgi:hypothetical protein